MRLVYALLVLISCICMACSPGGDSQESMKKKQTQPMHYETKNEQEKRLNVTDKISEGEDKYEQTKQQDTNQGKKTGPYTDLFTNDTSIQIEEHLKKSPEVKQAQVAATDDRVVVGIILRNRFEATSDIAEKIKTSIEEIVPNRQVVVYTDDIHWDRMRNLQSRMKRKKPLTKNHSNFLEKWFE